MTSQELLKICTVIHQRGLTIPQMAILLACGGDTLRVTDLSKRAGQAIPNASMTMDRVEAKRLIVRHRPPPNPSASVDRREVLINVTPKGSALVAELLRAINSELQPA